MEIEKLGELTGVREASPEFTAAKVAVKIVPKSLNRRSGEVGYVCEEVRKKRSGGSSGSLNLK